jgi:hypothetical protein
LIGFLLGLVTGAAASALLGAVWVLVAAQRTARKRAKRRALGLATNKLWTYRMNNLQTSKCKIGIVAGDIKNVKIAAIWVNGENTNMLMSRIDDNSVSAIIRYRGSGRDQAGRTTNDTIADELKQKVGASAPVVPGTAFVTTAGALKESNGVQFVIHVAAVQGQPGAGYLQVPDIGQCATNVLVEADAICASNPSASSILFPLLGTGTGRGAVEPTARALILATIDHITTSRTSLSNVYFLAYTVDELEALLQVSSELPQLVSETSDTSI